MPLTTTNTVNDASESVLMIPELWSAITADQREENLIIFNMYDRQYEREAGKQAYDTINIAGVNNFAVAGTLGVGGTLEYTAGQFANQIQLSIDQHIYHAFDIETEAELMTNISLMQKLTGKSAYAMALKMDDDAAGFIDDFGTNIVGTLGSPLDEEDVRTAMRLLNDKIVPESNRFFVMSPYQQAHFMGIERLTNSLYASAVGNLNVGPKFRGYFGTHHGADWYMTGNVDGTNSAGHANGMFHREAVATAVIDNMRTASMYEINTDSNKHAIHAIYGLIEVRDDHGVFMRGL